MQEVIDIDEEVRHVDGYHRLFLGVFDKKYCISAINIDITSHKLDEPATMLYTDDPVYSKYLISTFEVLRQQAIPAEERIQELLKQGPLKVEQ